MANRKYQGQLYQTATSSFVVSTDDGFEFRFQTWEDVKLEYCAESKIANNTDGSIGGYTTDPVKTSAGVKCRLDELQAFEDAVAQYYPNDGFLQIVFDFTVAYGNSLAKLRKDTGKVKFQKTTRDLPKSQDPLMADMPMLLLDFLSNGRKPIVFPV